MVTYEAMNMLFQFGIFLATALTAVVAMIALVTNKRKYHCNIWNVSN